MILQGRIWTEGYMDRSGGNPIVGGADRSIKFPIKLDPGLSYKDKAQLIIDEYLRHLPDSVNIKGFRPSDFNLGSGCPVVVVGWGIVRDPNEFNWSPEVKCLNMLLSGKAYNDQDKRLLSDFRPEPNQIVFVQVMPPLAW